MKYISDAKKGGFKVEKLERKEILNVNVLTSKNKENRVALIRNTKGRVVQKASVIVVKASWPNGYIIKDHIEQKDIKGTHVDVGLPKSKQILNLSKIVLQQKYPEQILLNTKKLHDLKTMSKDLHKAMDWVKELEEKQKSALDYKDDDETIFLDHTFERDESVRKKTEL